MSLRARVRALPKVELHVHLEGAIPLPAVWLNSDDPKMFNPSLEDEFEALATHLGFTRDEVQTLNRTALAAAGAATSRSGGSRR